MKSKRKQCDELWSKAVKRRAGFKCERCGKTTKLHAHHIIPRTNYALRYDLVNGVCLCYRCHFHFAHKDAMGFMAWIKDRRNLDYLDSRRHGQSKNDYELIRIYLENVLEGK